MFAKGVDKTAYPCRDRSGDQEVKEAVPVAGPPLHLSPIHLGRAYSQARQLNFAPTVQK